MADIEMDDQQNQVPVETKPVEKVNEQEKPSDDIQLDENDLLALDDEEMKPEAAEKPVLEVPKKIEDVEAPVEIKSQTEA